MQKIQRFFEQFVCRERRIFNQMDDAFHDMVEETQKAKDNIENPSELADMAKLLLVLRRASKETAEYIIIAIALYTGRISNLLKDDVLGLRNEIHIFAKQNKSLMDLVNNNIVQKMQHEDIKELWFDKYTGVVTNDKVVFERVFENENT